MRELFNMYFVFSRSNKLLYEFGIVSLNFFYKTVDLLSYNMINYNSFLFSKLSLQ